MSHEATSRSVVWAGVIGILAALLAGLGECALHYSSTGYAHSDTYQFFVHVAPWRLNVGHFLSIFSVPLYFVGYWHVYQRLQPAPLWARRTILLLGLYSFALGDVWLGSRVYVAQLVQARAAAEQAGNVDAAKLLNPLLQQASFYNENVLIGVRVGVLAISILLVALMLRGRTSYPRWMAALNPILLVGLAFVLYALLPVIGGVFMPVAMNFAHLIFFSVSTWLTLTSSSSPQPQTASVS